MTGGSFHSTEASGEVKLLMLKFYISLQNMLERLSRDEEGQTAVEYGLVTVAHRGGRRRRAQGRRRRRHY